MNVKINERGFLYVERVGAWNGQYCPYGRIDESQCGDWCPLFGEPRALALEPDEDNPLSRTATIFRICRASWNTDLGDTILDERPRT